MAHVDPKLPVVNGGYPEAKTTIQSAPSCLDGERTAPQRGADVTTNSGTETRLSGRLSATATAR
jgi:hypothetical protein